MGSTQQYVTNPYAVHNNRALHVVTAIYCNVGKGRQEGRNSEVTRACSFNSPAFYALSSTGTGLEMHHFAPNYQNGLAPPLLITI